MLEREISIQADRDLIPGIDWTSVPLASREQEYIVQESRRRPLRSMIGWVIEREGQDLWKRYQYDYAMPNDDFRTPQDLAIREGYKVVGRYIQTASMYYDDRYAMVGRLFRTGMYDEMNEPLQDVLAKDIRSEIDEAVESLTIDPSGIDWIMLQYKRTEQVWNLINKERNEYGLAEDPAVIGWRIGIERYKKLYREAIKAGAISDSAENRRVQISTKLRRYRRKLIEKI